MFGVPCSLALVSIHLKEQSLLPECNASLQWERPSLANECKGASWVACTVVARFGTGSREYDNMESRSQVCIQQHWDQGIGAMPFLFVAVHLKEQAFSGPSLSCLLCVVKRAAMCVSLWAWGNAQQWPSPGFSQCLRCTIWIYLAIFIYFISPPQNLFSG